MLAVTVPATSANLGCAFDCAALALDLRLVAEATTSPAPGLEIVAYGEGAASLPTDGSNLVFQAIARLLQWARRPLPGLRLHLRSEIPIGVGLGSSAAAIVAGLLLGVELAGQRPANGTLLWLAAEMDGHPDNVAAAYLGGLAVAAVDASKTSVMTRRAEVPAELRFVVAGPADPLATVRSRAVLPPTYSREDAVHNLQRTALLVASVFSGKFDFQPEFFDDRWHQARRAALVPGVAECLAIAHPDLLGVCLSGSGSSVMAITRDGAADEIAVGLRQLFQSRGVAARTLILSADNVGARVTSPPEPGVL
ncbi:MAG TPA: homoserine kinase [Candidatus Dormibacteraeota bacterium]|nr:homoserine kinase [Candidatus Dormibacteraeota bacterium]